MKIKYLSILFLLTLTSCAGISSSTSPSDGGGDNHYHVFSADYSYDEEYHWHAATCGHDVVDEKEPHSFTDDVCTVCGYCNNEWGTEDNPLSVSAALNRIANLEEPDHSGGVYVFGGKGYVAGIIREISISDEQYILSLVDDFSSKEELLINLATLEKSLEMPLLGDKVTVYGEYCKYRGNTSTSVLEMSGTEDYEHDYPVIVDIHHPTYEISVTKDDFVSCSISPNQNNYQNGTVVELTVSVNDSIHEISSVAANNKIIDPISEGKYEITVLGPTSVIVNCKEKGETKTQYTDILNQSLTGITGSAYTEFSNLSYKGGSSAKYSGCCAGGLESIQLRSKYSDSGIVSSTSGGTLCSISVKWNSYTQDGRQLNIYASNTAYSSYESLFSDSVETLVATLTKDSSLEDSYTFVGEYAYIGIRSAKDAQYLDSITITWEK